MKEKVVYKDYPFKEVCVAAEEMANRGLEVYQKFTCSGCGQRLTIAEPNVFHRTGTCDQCPTITDIEKQGCNYLIIGYGELPW